MFDDIYFDFSIDLYSLLVKRISITESQRCIISLRFIADITEEMCYEAIRWSSDAIKYIPERFITQELCNEAMWYFPSAVKYVPKKYVVITEETFKYMPSITRELCNIAVENDGNIIKYVPEEYLDTTICIAAVKQNVDALKRIPKKYLTDDVYIAAYITALCSNSLRFKSIPYRFRCMKEIYTTALECIGCNLRFIPANSITKEACMTAINNNNYALNFVPERLITEELCLLAAKSRGFPRTIVYKHITEEMCMEIIKHSELYMIPFQHRTKKACLAAYEYDRFCTKDDIPLFMLTEDFDYELFKFDKVKITTHALLEHRKNMYISNDSRYYRKNITEAKMYLDITIRFK
jgi:hypothetical protein